VLYPRLRDDLADLGHHAEVELMDRVRRAQEKHQAMLDELRRELTGATRDVGEAAPAHAG
jgi:hypothetical protein